VNRTGEIGAFKIVSDRGLAAGVRRLEALTSLNVIERLRRDEDVLLELSGELQVTPEEIPGKWREVSARLREQEKEIARLKVTLATGGPPLAGGSPDERAAAAWDGVVEVNGIKILARRVPSLPMNELRNLADTFRGKLHSGIVLLGTDTDGKATLLAAVTPDLSKRISAHDLAQAMAAIVGGKGGGRPELAQAGGKDPSQIEAALAAAVSRVREKLAGAEPA
jgi:alanyl-tRNA synthetase